MHSNQSTKGNQMRNNQTAMEIDYPTMTDTRRRIEAHVADIDKLRQRIRELDKPMITPNDVAGILSAITSAIVEIHLPKWEKRLPSTFPDQLVEDLDILIAKWDGVLSIQDLNKGN
jgi:DNA primase